MDLAPPIPAAHGSRCLREELGLLAGDLTILPATSTSPAHLQKIGCVHNSDVMELMRGLINQLSELISWLGTHDLGPRSLGLSHNLSRYKLKFSPKKVSQYCD